jgi:hypothetical protein
MTTLQLPRSPPYPKIASKISFWDQAVAEHTNPHVMANNISHGNRGCQTQHSFGTALQGDLVATRKALSECATGQEHDGKSAACTFQTLFEHTGGQIANLNRVLQRLKSAGEVAFAPECFLTRVNDQDIIYLLETFYTPAYTVNAQTMYREDHKYPNKHVPHEERKGRSHAQDAICLKDRPHDKLKWLCQTCGDLILSQKDRVTIRSDVYHFKCVKCIVCGASLRVQKSYMTYDGNNCCGPACIRRYDGANVNQNRN